MSFWSFKISRIPQNKDSLICLTKYGVIQVPDTEQNICPSI